MKYRNSYLVQIIVRSILLSMNVLALLYFMFESSWLFTSLLLCVLFVFQVFMLIGYLNKTNKDLARFLLHLKETNTTLNFDSHLLEQKFQGLTHAFEEVNKKFKEIKEDELRKEILLKTVLEQIETGVLAINDKEVRVFNRAFLKLFDMGEELDLQKLKKNSEQIYNLVMKGEGVGQQLVRVRGQQLLISTQKIKDKEGELKLFSVHDVAREMSKNELESWNGLIRVLMHETMNTLTPMSTVIDTMKECILDGEESRKVDLIPQKDIDDAAASLKIVEGRIGSLKDFVKRYRQFVHFPKLEVETFEVTEFIKRILEPLNLSLKAGIRFTCEENVFIQADRRLLEQVLFNLLKNSVEATQNIEEPRVEIACRSKDDFLSIEILDNGCGIAEDIKEKIFIPFFTTKEKGSGIGLSFARQIVFLHGGDIQIVSSDKGTCVAVKLKKGVP